MEQLDITFRNSPQPIRFVQADGTDAFPQSLSSPLPPPADDDRQPSPLPGGGGGGASRRKVSMSTFRRPSMGIPHPSRGVSAGAGAAAAVDPTAGGATAPDEPMRPTLGFLPTPDERGAHSEQQMRRRKARSRKLVSRPSHFARSLQSTRSLTLTLPAFPSQMTIAG